MLIVRSVRRYRLFSVTIWIRKHVENPESIGDNVFVCVQLRESAKGNAVLFFIIYYCGGGPIEWKEGHHPSLIFMLFTTHGLEGACILSEKNPHNCSVYFYIQWWTSKHMQCVCDGLYSVGRQRTDQPELTDNFISQIRQSIILPAGSWLCFLSSHVCLSLRAAARSGAELETSAHAAALHVCFMKSSFSCSDRNTWRGYGK